MLVVTLASFTTHNCKVKSQHECGRTFVVATMGVFLLAGCRDTSFPTAVDPVTVKESGEVHIAPTEIDRAPLKKHAMHRSR